MSDEGNLVSLRPLLHIPFDADLFHELNVERYELGKMGKLLFNHPQGTHDDRFWALAVYASEKTISHSRPIAHSNNGRRKPIMTDIQQNINQSGSL